MSRACGLPRCSTAYTGRTRSCLTVSRPCYRPRYSAPSAWTACHFLLSSCAPLPFPPTRSIAAPVGTWRAHTSHTTRLRPFVQAGRRAQTAAGAIIYAVGDHSRHHIRPALLGWPRPVGRAARLPAQRSAPSRPALAFVRAARPLGQATEPSVTNIKVVVVVVGKNISLVFINTI